MCPPPFLTIPVLKMGREMSRWHGRLDALKALLVSRAKEKGLYADGGGLYLQVSAVGTKSWIFRYRMNGRATPRDNS